MVMIAEGHGHAPPLRQPVSDQRLELRLAAQARLSGAASSGPICNPADLRVAVFSRVSYLDFEDAEPVTKTQGRLVADDDLDW